MPTGWKGSTRRATLGKDYWRARDRVMRRDGRQCQIRTPDVCTGVATECDHVGDRLDHSDANMRAACRPCHQRRSSQQGGAAYARAAQARVRSRKRPAEAHPGMRKPPTP